MDTDDGEFETPTRTLRTLQQQDSFADRAATVMETFGEGPQEWWSPSSVSISSSPASTIVPASSSPESSPVARFAGLQRSDTIEHDLTSVPDKASEAFLTPILPVPLGGPHAHVGGGRRGRGARVRSGAGHGRGAHGQSGAGRGRGARGRGRGQRGSGGGGGGGGGGCGGGGGRGRGIGRPWREQVSTVRTHVIRKHGAHKTTIQLADKKIVHDSIRGQDTIRVKSSVNESVVYRADGNGDIHGLDAGYTA